MTSVRLKLFADYRQIHLAAPATTLSLEDAWTEQATEERIAANKEIVGIGTEEAGNVSVSVEVLDAEPTTDLATWDHVTEASLSLPTGELLIAGCTDYWPDAKRMKRRVKTGDGPRFPVRVSGAEGAGENRGRAPVSGAEGAGENRGRAPVSGGR
jgi:hypothetical protein